MYKILHDKPQPLHKFGVEHAGDLQRILDKALAKDPKKRYQSVEQFARDLTSLFDEIRYEKSRIQRRLRTGAISKLSFFKNFNLQDVDEFTNVATWVQIEQGETVLSEGEIDKTFYVIVHGCAVVDKEGSQLISLKEGDCFGEMGMLHQNQRTTAIRANSELLLMKLSASDIDKLSEHCQAQYYKAIAHSLVDRLSQSEPSLKEAL